MEEIQALKKKRTWDAVALPQEKKTMVCEQMFKTQYKYEGSVDRYKAYFLAPKKKSFTQTLGRKTFTLALELNTIRASVVISHQHELATSPNGC